MGDLRDNEIVPVGGQVSPERARNIATATACCRRDGGRVGKIRLMSPV
jgi:hypothetical protein